MTGQRSSYCFVVTPPGTGAIGMIRLVGADALNIINRAFRPAGGRAFCAADGARLRYGRFVDGTDHIDDVIVSQPDFVSGLAIDIAAHGGVRVMQRILQTLDRLGAPVEQPALRAGCAWPASSLIEAEALDALSRAKTERAVRFTAWQRRHLVPALRRVVSQCRSAPGVARSTLEAMGAGFEKGRGLITGAFVVLVGPPNSGKSTLFNRLVGRCAALVSSRAGTTLDWVSEAIEMAGVPITLVDTAGRSEVDSPSQQRTGRSSRQTRERADLCVRVFDGSQAPPPAEQPRDRRTASLRRHVTVINKLDLGLTWDETALWPGSEPGRQWTVRVSARTGAGVDELVSRIVASLGYGQWSDAEPCFFTRRQMGLGAKALSELDQDGGSASSVIEELIGTRLDDATRMRAIMEWH